MAAYEYAVKGLCKAPAQKVGELLEKLEHSKNGLSPSTLLEASRKKGSLLYDDFEWNDGIAAEKWRLSQAQKIIQNVRIVIEKTDTETERKERGFVSIPGGKSAYVALQSAFSNEEWKNHLLNQAKEEMDMFIAKYSRLNELEPVIQAMKDIREKVV